MDDKERKKLISNVGVKGNVRYITITDNIPEHWPDIISIAESSYTWYAYIYHDKDDTEKHLHIVCYDDGGTTLKSHCSRFESVIPSNFVCKVFSPRAMVRYLIHKDSPEKHQYAQTDIVTNAPDRVQSFLTDYNSDCVQEFRDFSLVRSGRMPIQVFLNKYRGEFSCMSFYNKISTFSKLIDGMEINNNKENRDATHFNLHR